LDLNLGEKFICFIIVTTQELKTIFSHKGTKLTKEYKKDIWFKHKG